MEYTCQPLAIVALKSSSASVSEILLAEKYHFTGSCIWANKDWQVNKISRKNNLKEFINNK
jgi:hypothetical protein